MSSLELTEFFDNDDSEGHRLVEYIQQRRGVAQRQDFLFLNQETTRKSLKVNLERLPPKPKDHEEKTNDENTNGNEIGNTQQQRQQEAPEQSNGRELSVEELLASIHGETLVDKPASPVPTSAAVSPERNGNKSPIPAKSPVPHASQVPPTSPPASPIIGFMSPRPLSPAASSSTSKPLSPIRSKFISPKRPLSPKLSGVKKSGGGISAGDRLRRASLNRLIKTNHNGRRTLLHEFESTMDTEDFQPPVCSTPLSQALSEPTSTSNTKSSSAVDTENLVPNADAEAAAAKEKSPALSSDSCCGHTKSLIETLRRKDEQLKQFMGDMLETTVKMFQNEKEKVTDASAAVNKDVDMSKSQNGPNNNSNQSSLKRTYTIEKGQSPGQVILTPDKSTNKNIQISQSRQLRSYVNKIQSQNMSLSSRDQPCCSKTVKTHKRSINRSMLTFNVKSPSHQLVIKSPQNRLSKSFRQNTANCSKHLMGRSAIMVENAKASKQQDGMMPHNNTPRTPGREISIMFPATAQDLEINNAEVQNTQERNVSLILPTQEEPMDVEIPETQELVLKENENYITIQSNNAPVVVIPINNQTFGEKSRDNSVMIKASTKNESKNVPKTTAIMMNDEASQVSDDRPEDNLKLTDILTDDDDDEDEGRQPQQAFTSKIAIVEENNSQLPLNLAQTSTIVRSKRLRKRSLSRRQPQNVRSPLQSTETENDRSPPAAHRNTSSHNLRKRIVKRKHTILNRAPGTPLNGERFAQELKRMSNYEILDLRKRNSLGRVFAFTGRKATQKKKEDEEEACKKQLQLDNQIEMELLRRNLEKSFDKETEIRQNIKEAEPKEKERNEEENQANNAPVEQQEYPPVPEDFRDHNQPEGQEVQEQAGEKADSPFENSLIDEKSIDRISFKPESKNQTSMKRMSLKRKTKSVPQGNSDCEEEEANAAASLEKTIEDKQQQKKNLSLNKTNKTARRKSLSLPFILPSPPESETDLMPELRVVSPPPPLTLSLRNRSKEEEEEEEEKGEEQGPAEETNAINNMEQTFKEPLLALPIPPPPPEFDSDSGISSNNNNNDNIAPPPKPTQDTTTTTTTQNTNIVLNPNMDDNVFKKPLAPPPRKRNPKKPKEDNILLNDMHSTQDTSQDTSTLRRSKRQVSSDNTYDAKYKSFLQENLNKYYKAMEKTKERKKQKERELTKILRANGGNSAAQSVKSSEDIKKKRGRPIKSPSTPEEKKDNAIRANSNIQTTDTKKSSKKKPATKTNLTTEKKKEQEEDALMASLQNDMDILNAEKTTKAKKETKAKRKNNKKPKEHKEQQGKDLQMECSRINLTSLPPVDHFNNVFDQLSFMAREDQEEESSSPSAAAAIMTPPPPPPPPPQHEQINKIKKLRVRLMRFNPSTLREPLSSSSSSHTNNRMVKFNTTTNTLHSISTTSTVASSSTLCYNNTQSNFELISWLKNITQGDAHNSRDEIFKEMRISTAHNLCFSTIQGIEYAFYDTDEKASLGYLRFRPHQIKTKKRAKRYGLHFVVLVGQFRFTANDKEKRIAAGDMVAIEKFVYYDIENVTDDIGILMVIKK